MAWRIITKTNINDEIDSEPPNTAIDLQSANKIINIIGQIDTDSDLAFIIEAFTHSIANPLSKLSEGQRLNLLAKLDDLSSTKLPDKKNIPHAGYQVLAQSYIEEARRRSAQKSKSYIKRQHSQIVDVARNIENISDRILVMAEVAEIFYKIEPNVANNILEDAYTNVSQIPNVKDRVDRLEIIARAFSKLHNSSRATEAIKIAQQLTSYLDGIDRDSILASIIQTAHQIDKDIAAQITEKIEDRSIDYSLKSSIKSRDLSKAPHKLNPKELNFPADDEVIGSAALKMMQSLNSGRSAIQPQKVIMKWLLVTKDLSMESSLKVANWAIEALMKQISYSHSNRTAITMINFVLQMCQLIYDIGLHLSHLSTIPDEMKHGFHGLSTTRKLIKAGERSKAIEWISNWLKTNAKENVKICDPYFDSEQLWILQVIPIDISVKIVCTGNKLGIMNQPEDRSKLRSEKERIRDLINRKWNEISSQAPPATFFVIHNSIYDDKDGFHDRYITTKDAGLSIGTSLNGFGNKEFFISVLTSDDVHYVNDTYINPKLNIQDFFSKVIYFDL